MGGFASSLKEYDSFGTKAEFTYKKSHEKGAGYDTSVKTKFGATSTLIYYAMFLAVIVVKTIDLFDGHDSA